MTSPYLDTPSVLMVIGEEDKNYVSRLGGALGGIKTKVYSGEVITITDLVAVAKRNGLNHVITTRQDVLKKLLPTGREKKANISNYSGSLIPWSDTDFLILDPLKQLITVPYGDFLARRYISKITKRNQWKLTSEFNFHLIKTEAEFIGAKNWLSNCHLVAIDIETWAPNKIRCIGYCGFKIHPDGRRESLAFVIPLDQIASMEAVSWMRRLNWDVKVPKVLQNGKYDIAVLAAWNAPIWGYFFDTVNAFHSWLSELPKDLASIVPFFVRNSMYWKDLADSSDAGEYYRYNALDCWGTGESFLSWLEEAPTWAKKNYVKEFSIVPACHMCELTGIARDQNKLEDYNKKYTEKMAQILVRLQKMIGPGFNPSSTDQVLRLMHTLGYRRAEDTTEKTITEASYAHPLNELIIGLILEFRGLRKLISTYLPTKHLAKEWNGRILFSLNPHGTDTARKSSREFHFFREVLRIDNKIVKRSSNYGLNIQNIPRDSAEGAAVKDSLMADEGFDIWEADLKSAEAYGVAYSSGDETLLRTIESGKDFHSTNASLFFGIPYDEIYDDEKKKVLNKPIRQVSKETNHGANYNMGDQVLLDTMGSKKVRQAQALLKLPTSMRLIEVTGFLLKVFARTYPRVKTTYYEKIKHDVKTTGLLVGATGWTRKCFGNPSANKLALNAYVAHVTQSLNAVLLDPAFLQVFLQLGFNPNFKLITQIHDSILFQVRHGHEHLAKEVARLMTVSVPITDCLGITRTMTVPVDLKKLGRYWKSEE